MVPGKQGHALVCHCMKEIEQGYKKVGNSNEKKIWIVNIFFRVPGYHKDRESNDDAKCLSQSMKDEVIDIFRKVKAYQGGKNNGVVSKVKQGIAHTVLPTYLMILIRLRMFHFTGWII